MTTTLTGTGPILIGYDGSVDAAHAITTLATLMPDAHVHVLYAYESLQSLITHQWVIGGSQPALDMGERQEHAAAEEIATAGAKLATDAGLVTETRIARGQGPVWQTILLVADDLDASLLVVGSRGRRGLPNVLLGDIAHSLAQHAHRPVLLVPSPALATARNKVRTATSAHAVTQPAPVQP